MPSIIEINLIEWTECQGQNCKTRIRCHMMFTMFFGNWSHFLFFIFKIFEKMIILYIQNQVSVFGNLIFCLSYLGFSVKMFYLLYISLLDTTVFCCEMFIKVNPGLAKRAKCMCFKCPPGLVCASRTMHNGSYAIFRQRCFRPVCQSWSLVWS